MGISKLFAEMILREHARQPLFGAVLLAGRQTVELSASEALQLAKGCGVDPACAIDALQIDKLTMASAGNDFITDKSFFAIMALSDVSAVDVSAYEGADFVYDLCTHLPEHMKDLADVVVDGSTLDNVFDPAMALRNIVTLLRPGGYLFMANTGSNNNCPYTILTPLWFYDYFVVNSFQRVQVYVVLRNTFGYRILALMPQNARPVPPAFTPNIVEQDCSVTILVIAQKGVGSTSAATPFQHQYRSDGDWNDYLNRVPSDPLRPDPFISGGDIDIHVPPGYRLVK